MKIKLAKTENIHFIGIGGIGMSGLAIIMKGLGFKVQGSDSNFNKNLERLKKNKINYFIGHKKKNIINSTIIVVSSAIPSNNPEIKEAKRRNLPIYKRGEVLGQIVSLMKNIVVAGSHGKTTTTSLISSIFSETKIDATIINGGVLNSYGNSAKLGKSEWCILESDESDGSFLKIPITYSVVTNIDKEHLDFYKSIDNLKNNFQTFVENTPSFGKCYVCLDNKTNRDVLKKIKNKNFLTYGINRKTNFTIKNILQKENLSQFDLIISLPGRPTKIIKKIKLPIIGVHNIRNATAAAAVSHSIGISDKMIKKGLKNYQGVQRRFNYLFEYKKSIFIDDYAHHPTEIKSVLNGVKAVYKKRKIYSIFQPHRVSRLNDLKAQFETCFEHSNYVVLCPVFKAGEKIRSNVNYRKFASNIAKKSNTIVIIIKNEKELIKFIKQNIFGENIVIGMGAGSISSWMKNLKFNLK